MIPRDCEPVEHRPPLSRIDLSPRYEPVVEPTPDTLEVAIAEAARQFEARENARIWKELQQVASGNG